MRQSQLFSTTKRNVSADEESINANLLTRGGYIHKQAAGVVSFLPLGLRVIERIKEIVRDELNKLPATQEVLMPALQPRDIWEETGRWNDEGMKEVMYRVEELGMGLGPTHEENVTDLFRNNLSSYKELPVAVYQIQTKFRKELRAKSGLLRGREFMMKDLYSFHADEASLDVYYDQAIAAYQAIFSRMGLHAVVTEASGGVFSKQHSHEFQVINPVGEDTIYLNEAGDYAWNQEVVSGPEDPKLIEWSGGVRAAQATEVGNIFKLGTKFTEAMQAEVTLENGERLAPVMGCYGIGISRLMGIVCELYGDVEKGKIAWPSNVAPFKMHLIDLTPSGEGAAVYESLRAAGKDVLFDDRDKSAGEKFADADLVGAPIRIVVSKRSLEAGGAEVVRNWNTAADVKEILPISKLTEL